MVPEENATETVLLGRGVLMIRTHAPEWVAHHHDVAYHLFGMPEAITASRAEFKPVQ